MNNPFTSFSTSSSSNSTTIPQQRLQSLTSQLSPTSQTSPKPITMASPPQKDPITCHVLDTTTGRPGASIVVTLSPLDSPTTIFHSTTNSDGRVANWSLPASLSSASTSASAGEQISTLIRDLGAVKGAADAPSVVPVGSSLWKLQFATGEYYGIDKTFFPIVELTFLVKEGEHFHVPLLLGPYSFTTYRGS